jgi:hypothetical protein
MGEALDVSKFRSSHYTVVIYWRKRKGIDALQNGHAALIIDTAQINMMNSEYYVSWMGEGKPTGGLGTIFAANQASYAYDAGTWGGERVHIQPGNAPPEIEFHRPSRWVCLKGLHIGSMKEAWDQMRGKENAHWKLLDKNCATAVARILKAGGGDSFARSNKSQLVWWPTDLLKYAKSMGPNVVETS